MARKLNNSGISTILNVPWQQMETIYEQLLYVKTVKQMRCNFSEDNGELVTYFKPE